MVKIQECSDNMFWGVTIDSGKKYSQTVKQAFHVSMAALDLNGRKNSENVQVMVQHDSSEFLLCTLNDKVLQQSLDLNFETGEEVAFSLNGSGVVHLTGYLALDVDDLEDESFSDSDEEVPSLVDTTQDSSVIKSGKKRKNESAGQTPKKVKLSTSDMLDDVDSDDDEDDEDFSDDFDEDEFPDDDDSEIDSEDDDEEEDDIDSDEVDEVLNSTAEKKKTPKLEKSVQKEQGAENKNTPKKQKKAKDAKTPQQSTPAQNKSESEQPVTPENGESSSKKKRKRKKKNKGDNSMSESDASTPAQTPKTETTPKKKVVAGGTIVEDIKVGHGPEAKPGKMVSVYYVGTLAKNQKRFDSCQGGKPFRFRLNQGEVIKGWDNGVNGMKVGGKRKITVPANQGYGNVKQGPIPPNSTLVFEVELKAVN